ncbi:MAG: DNA primase [Planctomycetota bacterium]
MISDAQKEDIRNRVPLEELLPEYNVQLVPAGGRKLKALCPFHREKTPSFSVDPEKQFYYCFGCQEAGDVYRFVEAMEGVNFAEAVRILARRAGVVLDEVHSANSTRLVGLHDAGEFAAGFYHHLLLKDPRAQAARDYLDRRGIQREMWAHFRLGCSTQDWDALVVTAARNGHKPETLERAGLARRRRDGNGFVDAFRNRLMFPILDPQKRVIGFGARTLGDDTPKYLNTPKTDVFDKSQVLYGLTQARPAVRREAKISIVEGYTDVIMAHQAGLQTFVASLGTAFTEENARQLRRLAPRVEMIFDGDAAGQKALERSLDLLVEEELDVRVYVVRDGKDPCDAVLALGGEEFGRKVSEEGVGLFEFKWRVSVDAVADQGPDARARGIDSCLELVQRIPSEVRRQLVLRELASKAGLEIRDLSSRLRELSAPRRRFVEPVEVASGGASKEEKFVLSELAVAVLTCMFVRPAAAAEIWGHVPQEIFGETAVARDLVEGVVRLLERGAFTAEQLVAEIQNSEARRAIVEISSAREVDEKGDNELRWENCLRDIRRWEVQRRVSELDGMIQHAKSLGDQERVRTLWSQRVQLRKSLKRGVVSGVES